MAPIKSISAKQISSALKASAPQKLKALPGAPIIGTRFPIVGFVIQDADLGSVGDLNAWAKSVTKKLDPSAEPAVILQGKDVTVGFFPKAGLNLKLDQ